ncbi:restriction endonuclease subunit S [Alteromonas abrolhosensis]|uniref:restriction endonuclease subunit S n=1 Tax=Alteromonas abrolhosensis TaxID=1892904 RepID=UPI00096BBA75|nr:restriction endonuclease subunit S [Alteromonas abrolhosensis]
MSELPKGWKLSPISELADVQAGIGFPKRFQGVTSAKYPVYKVGDLSRAYLNDKALVEKAENYVSEEVAAELKGKIFKEGAILFAKIGEALRLNRRVKVVREGLADNNVMAVVPKDCVDNNYLFRFLQYYDIASLSRSTTVPSIRKGDVENVPVPHPDLDEQKRIADKLDSVFAKVEAAQARLDKIPTILKRFRQSVLAAAISGELTKEWRERQSNLISPLALVEDKRNRLLADGTIKPSKQNSAEPIENENTSVHYSWKYSRLISICSLITDGKHGNCKDESNSGYYFLSAKDIKGGELIYENSRQINKYEFQEVHNRTNLEPLDICIVNTGATVGKLALAPFSAKTQKTTFQKSVAVVKVIKPFIVPQYVAIVFEEANKRLLKSSTGTAVNNLLLSTMKQLIIPIPSTEEQLRIVSKVDELSEQAKAVEKQYYDAKARLDKLTQSLLAKAFKGELLSSSVESEVTEIENSVEAIHA